MELVTLNAQMQPDKPVENYDSLIWTERFNTVGDFQITTGMIDYFMEALPEGKVISLTETPVPMIVETHSIVRKKNEAAVLTITGRSFESILDRRVSIQGITSDAGEWKVVGKIPSDVAHYVIHKICVEGIVDPLDIFPSSVVQFITPADYLTATGPNREFIVSRGNLLNTVIGFIQIEARADASTDPPSPVLLPHGIKAMRPSEAGSSIGIQIYTGTDRRDTVYFDATRDLLNDGAYLFSKKGSATDAYLVGQNISGKLGAGEGERSGMDRRVILIDGSSSTIENIESLQAEGERALSEASVTAIFDGSINEDLSPYKYGVDYGLGDVVNVKGDYGLDMKARVTEYIRSYDATGKKAYPTLSALEDQE